MNTTPSADLPVPAGATADDWCDMADIDDGMARALTWSRYDTDKVGVAVEGWQYADGSVDRCISL
jgi:hypothetical protein